MGVSTRAAARVAAGDRTLVPLARTWIARLPVFGGALVWSRPFGVVVRAGSERGFLRVRDHTRRAQLAILGAALVGALLGRRARRR